MTETALDHYSFGEKIGSGGMGDVFRGIDQRTNTAVAIKELKAELATPEMVQRFMREGEALRQLDHPNIVKLLDAVQENGRYYLIMELVEGGALDEMLKRAPRLTIDQVLNIALDLADALTRAHRLNIIHRDIKPANILFTQDRMLRLTDFGIARVVNSDITETGSVLGTLAYIAPEVLQGQPADARSDIWSMGLVLFEMLVGTHLFQIDHSPGELIYSILNTPFPDLETLRPDAPAALVDVINRMVMKDPAERIPRMRLVGAELEAILANDLPTPNTTTKATQLVVKVEPVNRFDTPPNMATTPGLRHNLPLQPTELVGREVELSKLEAMLRDNSVRLLTIVGTGGMGKTHLALEVGSHLLQATDSHRMFPQGVYFVDLAPVTSADHIVGAVAEALGYIFQQDGRDPAHQVFNYLHEKALLLILDNFEHVIAGRDFVQDMLRLAPSIKILITSREKLNLSAETVYTLSGIAFPTPESAADMLDYGAVKLFVQSAQRVRRDLPLDADSVASIARICHLVQGTPLGILLAASWVEVLTLGEIADEISRSMDFLESELHDLPERQRSLRAVFEYSWNLLAEPERDLFARFSVFRGGFTRDAALQITNTNLRALTTLVNKSLLRRDNVTGRYEVHELLRQYAEEKLKQSASVQAVLDTYSRYYMGLLAQLAPKLKGYGQLEALNLIDTDFENIRAAWNGSIKRKNAPSVEAAVEGLYLYLTFRNRWMDGEQLFGAARQVWSADVENPPLLAEEVLVRFPGAAPLNQYRKGLAIAQQQNDAFEIAFCQRLVGHWLSHNEYNQVEGVPLMEASLSGFRALGSKFYAAQILDDLGWSYQLMVKLTAQEQLVKQSLELRREIGDKIGTANSLRNLGGARGGTFDNTDSALNYWEEAKGIAYEMNDRLGIAWNASLQAANLIFKGQFEGVEALLDEAYPHADDLNDPVVKGFILLLRAGLAALRDEDYVRAKRLVDEGFPPESPPDFRITIAPFIVSVIASGFHDFQLLRPYDAISRVTPFYRDDVFMPIYTPSRIIQLADRQEYEHAVELLYAFMKVSITFAGYPFAINWINHWGLFSRVRAEIETQLDRAVYQAARQRGEQMTVEQLIQEIRVFLDEITS